MRYMNMLNQRLRTVKLGWISLIFMLVCPLFLTGCRSWKGNVPNSELVKPNMNLELPVNPTTLLRYKIAWLPSVGIVAASLAIAAIFLGATRLGIAVLVASLFGVWMAVTVSHYAVFLAIAGLVSAVALAVATILKVKKTNTGLVKGIQSLKGEFRGMKPHINRVVGVEQDRDVVREVKRIKKQIAVKAAKIKEKLR